MTQAGKQSVRARWRLCSRGKNSTCKVSGKRKSESSAYRPQCPIRAHQYDRQSDYAATTAADSVKNRVAAVGQRVGIAHLGVAPCPERQQEEQDYAPDVFAYPPELARLALDQKRGEHSSDHQLNDQDWIENPR